MVRRLHPLGVLALAAPLAGCGSAGGAPESAAEVAPAVEAVAARHGSLPLEERLNGVVRGADQVLVRSEITATVVEVRVRSGEAVRRGEVLVRLQDDALREQLRQAEASVRLEEAAARAAQARVSELLAQVRRARALAAQQLVSALDLETQEAQLAFAEASAAEARARVEQARATVEERRAAVQKAEVRAPMAGRVGRRSAEVGMLAQAGALLFEIGSLRQLIVEVPLTGEMLSHIREGQSVVIRSAALGGEPLHGTLARIPPFLSAGTFSTFGEIDVRNPAGRLHPGMFVAVDILYGESEKATLVPGSALHEDPSTGAAVVYVVENPAGASGAGAWEGLSKAALAVTARSVEVVAEGRAAVGVRGVEPGQWVVTLGQQLLSAADARARVRLLEWERVLALQSLQREDLMRSFLAKQRRLARERGAVPPTNQEFLGAGSAAPAAGPASGNGS
jgi:RND family efflux transporter MFP subunit